MVVIWQKKRSWKRQVQMFDHSIHKIANMETNVNILTYNNTIMYLHSFISQMLILHNWWVLLFEYTETFLPFILWDLWHGFSTSMIPIFLKKPFFATEALLHYFLLRLHKMIKFCNCSQKKRGNLLVKSIPVLISEYISLFGIAICIFLSVYMIIFNWCTIRESHVYISLDLTKYHSIYISRKIKHILMHLAID